MFCFWRFFNNFLELLKGCRWAGREAMGNTHPRCKAASLEVWVTVCFSGVRLMNISEHFDSFCLS